MTFRLRLLLVALGLGIAAASAVAIVMAGPAAAPDSGQDEARHHLLVIALAAAAGGGAAVLVVIELAVLRPLFRLGRDLAAIAAAADPGQRVPVAGAAEVVAAARAANATLAALERALARLEQQAAEHATLLQAIPDRVLLVAPDGTCTPVAGPSDGSDVIEPGAPLARLVPLDERGRLRELVTGATQGHRGVMHYRSGGARVRHHEMRLLPVEGGRVLALVRDITARVEDEQRLQRAIDAAEAANRAKSAFLANLSHELRSPLNGILGMAQLFAGERLPELQRERVAVIADSAEDLLTLINQLLDLSKIGSERMELVEEPFVLADVVHHVVDALASRAWIKGVDVVLVGIGELPERVRGDAGRLRQVLTNLVANAIKFTERGEVVVRVRCDRAAGDRLVLHGEVSDTGPGIAPDVAARLFRPFEQGGAAIADRHGGTGLGLAIAKGLVELMGGRIGLESTPGQGATFRFNAVLRAMSEPTAVPPERGSAAVLCPGDNLFEAVAEALAGAGLRAVRGAHAGAVLTVVDADVASAPPREPAVLLVGPRWRGTSGPRLAAVRKPCHPQRLREAALQAMSGRAGAPVPAPRRTPSSDSLPAARVLVVDDQPVNRAIAVGLLRTLGMAAEDEADPVRAVDRIIAGGWDLVLMDCRMPGMDGLEVTRRVRAAERPRRTAIVALTANAMSEDRERCLAAGMDDHLAKPLHLADLEAVLLRWLGHAALPQAAPGTVASAVRLQGLADRFAELSAQAGREAVAEAARGLLDSVPVQLQECAAAIAAGSSEALLDASHALRGDAASCRIDALAEPAGELAEAARGGRCDRDLLPVLERARTAWAAAEGVVRQAAG